MTGTPSATHSDTLDMNALMLALWRAKWRVTILTMVLCILTYLALSFVPKMYESSASILVEPRQNFFIEQIANGNAQPSDDVVMSSQEQLIKSADTQLAVIRSLDLAQVPEFSEVKPSLLDPLMALLGRGGQQLDTEQLVLARLAKRVTVIRERDSRVISIYVRSEDRQLAANIANALAEAHISRRAQQSIDDTQEATQWLEAEIEKLRASVSEAEADVAKFRVEHDLFVGPNNTTLVDQQLSDTSAQITQAQERKSTARTRANLIRELINSGRSISAVPDVQDSLVIQSLSEEKASLQRNRAELLATLLPNHPNIQALTAQIDEIEGQINIEGRRVADALEAQAQIEASAEASLRDDLARLKLSASDASGFTVQLQELEREANAQRDLLETYLLRFRDALARTDSSAALPDLRQITLAVPAIRPASPQTMLLLVAVGMVSLMVQLGAIIFMQFAKNIGQQIQSSAISGAAPKRIAGDEPAGLQTNSTASRPKRETRSNPLPSEDLTARATDPSVPLNRQMVADLLRQERQAAAGASQATPPERNHPADTFSFAHIDEIAHALLHSNTRIAVVAGQNREVDGIFSADCLAAEMLEKGHSVAFIDAGSGELSDEKGLSDLSRGLAEFGEIVHRVEGEALFEVPWGNQQQLDPSSKHILLLAEALSDLNDCVIVFAGNIDDDARTIAAMAGITDQFALVLQETQNGSSFHQARKNLQQLGYAASYPFEERVRNVARFDVA